MIYTVTLNPSLDYIISVKDFRLGYTNRTQKENLFAGGKGINVSLMLKTMGIDSIALGFIAGFTGNKIAKDLLEQGISTDFIEVENGFSRINVKIDNPEGTELNGMGPHIQKKEVDLFLHKIKALGKGDVLVLSGSIPPTVPADIYKTVIKELQNQQVLTIVDTSGKALIEVLAFQPFLIKPNQQELQELFNVEISNKEDAIFYAKRLVSMGAQNVIISMAGDGAVFVGKEGEIFRKDAVQGEYISGVGAGDSMIAGFLAGWIQYHDYEQAFELAVAAGSATAFSEGLADSAKVIHCRNLMQ